MKRVRTQGAHSTATLVCLTLLLSSGLVDSPISAAAEVDMPTVEAGAADGWHVTLDNGAQVALLAVASSHPGPDPVAEPVSPVNGLYWVTPDGKPTEPYTNYTRSNPQDSFNRAQRVEETYAFVARIAGPDSESRFDRKMSCDPQQGSSLHVVSGDLPPNVYYMYLDLPADLYRCDVKVLVGAGPWATLSESDRDDAGNWVMTKGEANNGRVESVLYNDKGKLEITVLHQLTRGKGYQFDLLVFDSEGRQQRCSTAGSTKTPEGTRETFYYEPAPADVKKVQFCRRPYQRVRFKNVQLRPAPEPNIKRGTLSPELRGKAAEVGEKENWTAAFQLAPDVTLAKVAHGESLNIRSAWCTPGGKPLSETPFFGIRNERLMEGRYPYRFALAVPPLRHSVRLRMQTEPPSIPVLDADLDNYRRYFYFREGAHLLRTVYLPMDARSCDVRIGVAGGDFEATAVDAIRGKDGSWSPNTAETPDGKITVGPLEERDGRTLLKVVHSLKDMDIRVRVYSETNDELETQDLKIRPQPDGTCLAELQVNASAAAVHRVHIQTRPFQWAVYKGVVLPPAEIVDKAEQD